VLHLMGVLDAGVRYGQQLTASKPIAPQTN
jgi:hypothetical protein